MNNFISRGISWSTKNFQSADDLEKTILSLKKLLVKRNQIDSYLATNKEID